MRSARVARLVALLLCFASAGDASAQASAPAPFAASAPAAQESPEERLWREIVELRDRQPPAAPFRERVVALREHKQSLLSYVRLYQRLYPGGRHGDDACTIELTTLYELGSLDGGRFDALRQRVGECLDSSSTPEVLHEAAYWRIQLDRVDRYERLAAATQPSSAPLTEPDLETLAAFEKYIDTYPASRHTPRMAERLFFHALSERRLDRCEALAAALQRAHPAHPVAALLAGRLRRERAIGQPFSVRCEPRPGHPLDTADWRGKTVLVVVWLGADRGCRGLAREIDALLDLRPDIRALGVNLDESRQAMDDACRELEIDWDQWNDGHGMAHAFALEWGVREVPLVFVVGPDGRLRDVSSDGWREAVSRPEFIDTGGGGG